MDHAPPRTRVWAYEVSFGAIDPSGGEYRRIFVIRIRRADCFLIVARPVDLHEHGRDRIACLARKFFPTWRPLTLHKSG